MAESDSATIGGNVLDAGSGQRKVTELLLEQVECADIVIINKCDLLNGEDEVKLVEKVHKRNPQNKYSCKYYLLIHTYHTRLL